MATNLTKAQMSIRLPVPRWHEADKFEELLQILQSNPGVADELALFVAFSHPPMPLEMVRELVPVLKQRIKHAKSKGFRCGVNILSTLGHHEENLEHSFQGDYTRRTDIDGNVCLGSFCPNDKSYVKDYVVPLYTSIVECGPDFIWIDDDVRSGHMPIGPDCFCDFCLKRFADTSGSLYSREEIRSRMDSDTETQKVAFRKLWLQSKRDTINDLFKVIEETVSRISPQMALGFMTGERYADGYGFNAQAEILAGPLKRDVMWRPGGGFYNDIKLVDMVEKSHQIGRQASLLPPSVVSIQAEIENFNYTTLGKSVHITTTEVASHIAAGCTGAALNIIGGDEDLSKEKSNLFSGLSFARPFYDALVNSQMRNQTLGIYTGWTTDSEAVKGLEEGFFSGTDGYNVHFADSIFELGLPMSYSPEGAQMSVISGNLPYAMDESLIMDLLKKGVLMDGQALDSLNNLGYGEYTGYKVSKYINDDCVEKLNGHAMNGEQAGDHRNTFQSFWKCPCASIIPTAQTAEDLALAVDYAGNLQAECVMGIYENKLGGRICIAGYSPWEFINSYSKANQYKNIIRWLAKDTIPAYISSLHKANLWARRDGEKSILTILSSSMDPAEKMTIHVITDSDTLKITDRCMNETVIKTIGTDGNYKVFELPALAPWNIYLAVTE